MARGASRRGPASIFWTDAWGERPACRSGPDYPVGANIESVGGGCETTGLCRLGPDGGQLDWEITRIE